MKESNCLRGAVGISCRRGVVLVVLIMFGLLLLGDDCVAQALSDCSTEKLALDSCPTRDGCNNCLVAAFDTIGTLTTCSDSFSETICPLIASVDTGCPCNGCQLESELYLQCIFAGNGCPFVCGFDGTEYDGLSNGGILTQTFEARWLQIGLDTATNCTFGNQNIEITCTEGNSIQYVSPVTQADQDSITCQKTATDTLACVDNAVVVQAYKDGGVVFECIGPTLAGSTLTLQATTSNCNVVPDGGRYESRVILATECNEGELISSEYFLECTAAERGVFSALDNVYICYTPVEVPSAAGVQSLDMPAVTVSTSNRSVAFAQANGCYKFEPDPSAPATMIPTEECFTEEMAFQECFDKQCSDADACEQCMIDRLDTTLASQCTDFSTILCSYIQTDCPCTNCEYAAELWLQCVFKEAGCQFLCNFPVDPVLDAPVCTVPSSPASAQPIAPPSSTVGPVISPSTQPIEDPQVSSTNLPVLGPTVEPVSPLSAQPSATHASPTNFTNVVPQPSSQPGLPTSNPVSASDTGIGPTDPASAPLVGSASGAITTDLLLSMCVVIVVGVCILNVS